MILRPRTARNGVPTHRFVKAIYNPTGQLYRPMSNLLSPKEFPLKITDYTSAIALFRMRPGSWRSTQMWASVFAEIVYPTLPQAKDISKVAKENKEVIKVLSEKFTRLESPVLAQVKKTKTGATASLAVFATDSRAKLSLASCVTIATMSEYSTKNQEALDAPVGAKSVDTDHLGYAGLKAADRNVLKSLKSTFRIESTGTQSLLFLDLVLTRSQVENICNNDFDDVRPIDLYGLIRTWAQARTDTGIRAPGSTKPLADIASTLPTGGEPRLSKDGILVDSVGDFYCVPEKLDNISRYDTALALALMGEDGMISQFHPDGIRKLPVQQNVFIDWVNYKWSFVNTSGNLEVRDLSRAQPCNVTHIRTFLSELISVKDRAISWVSRVSQLGSSVGGEVFSVRERLLLAVSLINLHPDYEGTTVADFRIYHLRVLADMASMPQLYKNAITSADFAPYVGFCETVRKLVVAMRKDPDSYYKDWSVATMASFEAMSILFDKYAKDFDNIDAQDKDKRAKYLAPSLDPTFTMPELPFLAQDRGLMPHQFNGANMLRDSPDNAILAVDAGGGKTAQIVADILKEMKGGIKGPFLVMCPAHLIPQYVIEFSYFTSSRINVIPVTAYTTKPRRGGLAAIARMIDVSPVNSVVLCDYNLAKGGKTIKVGYGTNATQIYKIVEFLRQFRFNYVALDESHYLKNMDATQSRAVATLITDIPKKRLASGTFMANSPEDIAGQFSLLDPSVFGSVDDFSKEYSAGGAGGKIRKMRVGASLEILNKLRSNCRYIQIKRKEWASLLPPRIESMDHFVTLSPAQRTIYDSILESSVEQLKLAAQSNKKLASMLGILAMSDEDREHELSELDEGEDKHSEMSGGLDELLRPYLARLEQFLCAPSKDLLGSSLQGSDRLSPKIAEFVKICRAHIAEDIPGKILAFTNQTASAEEIYNNLPSDLKDKFIYYTAGQKEACGADFENNPAKIGMIGVGQSMETGLNLQHASRLIRCETVMSPGALEQGNSRIGRPNIKKIETRSATYYDWILVNRSIDVTKVAYLLTKKVRIAAIEEADNPIYANLEVPELFKLTLENIQENNTVDTLAPYLDVNSGMYREYSRCVTADYKQFQDTHRNLLDKNGVMKMIPLVRSADLEGSRIMRRVPYVPGLDIYGTKELGLVRLDQYLRVSAEVGDEEDEDEGGEKADIVLQGDDSDAARKVKQAQADFKASIVGLNVHTELGDGVLIAGSIKAARVSVRYMSGEVKPISMLAAFVITKPQTSGKDIRLSLAKMTGTIPIDTPYEVKDVDEVLPTDEEVKVVKTKSHSKVQEFSLNLMVSNDMIALELDNPEDNKLAARTLMDVKFLPSPKYFYAQLKTPQAMNRFFSTLQAEGYTMPKTSLMAANLEAFYLKWVRMRKNSFTLFGQASSAGLRNFYNVTHKPNPDPKVVDAYITVENEQVFVCLPSQGHKANNSIVNKIHVPTVKFFRSAPQLIRFFPTPSSAINFIKSLRNSGTVLSNEDELKAAFVKLHKIVPKATKLSMEDFFKKKIVK